MYNNTKLRHHTAFQNILCAPWSKGSKNMRNLLHNLKKPQRKLSRLKANTKKDKTKIDNHLFAGKSIKALEDCTAAAKCVNNP